MSITNNFLRNVMTLFITMSLPFFISGMEHAAYSEEKMDFIPDLNSVPKGEKIVKVPSYIKLDQKVALYVNTLLGKESLAVEDIKQLYCLNLPIRTIGDLLDEKPLEDILKDNRNKHPLVLAAELFVSVFTFCRDCYTAHLCMNVILMSNGYAPIKYEKLDNQENSFLLTHIVKKSREAWRFLTREIERQEELNDEFSSSTKKNLNNNQGRKRKRESDPKHDSEAKKRRKMNEFNAVSEGIKRQREEKKRGSANTTTATSATSGSKDLASLRSEQLQKDRNRLAQEQARREWEEARIARERERIQEEHVRQVEEEKNEREAQVNLCNEVLFEILNSLSAVDREALLRLEINERLATINSFLQSIKEIMENEKTAGRIEQALDHEECAVLVGQIKSAIDGFCSFLEQALEVDYTHYNPDIILQGIAALINDIRLIFHMGDMEFNIAMDEDENASSRELARTLQEEEDERAALAILKEDDVQSSSGASTPSAPQAESKNAVVNYDADKALAEALRLQEEDDLALALRLHEEDNRLLAGQGDQLAARIPTATATTTALSMTQTQRGNSNLNNQVNNQTTPHQLQVTVPAVAPRTTTTTPSGVSPSGRGPNSTSESKSGSKCCLQ